MSNVERIEVLKGPASVLYGRQDLGGIVNVVTKKPLNVPYRRFEQTAGSHSLFRSTLDLAGPINESKTLLYRVNGAYEQGDTFRDFISDDVKSIAPALTWIAGSRTSLSFSGEYLDESRRYDSGLVAVGDRVADIPVERNLRDPENDYRNVEAFMGTIELDQGFGRGWNLRVAARGYSGRLNAFTAAGPASLKADNRTITRTYFYTPINDRSNFTGQAEVSGGFDTGRVAHQLIAGIEQGSGREELAFRSGPSTDLDIFAPVYGISNPTIAPGFGTWQLDQSRHSGVFVQDQISFTPQWKVVVGGRYDMSDEKRTNLNTGAQRHQEPDAFSPRFGVIYQPNQIWSYYASYSESFLPRLGSNFDGEPFVPEEGEQFEVGAKADFLDGRVSGTAAVFELTRSNVTTIDPQHTGFSIQVGEQRSRGLELSLVGLVTNNLRMIGSYTFTDGEVTADNSPTIKVGNGLASIPEHMASLWSSYTFSAGTLEGLGAGAGLFYVSDRWGDLQNTFKIGSYVRADASVFYRFPRYTLGLNVKNLANTRYMESSLARTSIAPGTPRAFYLTAGFNF
jgi:iron complex outermembrane receptor protein